MLHLFIYFCLRWIFIAAHRLSPVVATGGGCSLVAVHGLLIAVASRVVDHRLWGVQASVVVAQQLQFPGFRKPRLKVVALRLSCSMACEIFLGSGIKPWAPCIVSVWSLSHWTTREAPVVV